MAHISFRYQADSGGPRVPCDPGGLGRPLLRPSVLGEEHQASPPGGAGSTFEGGVGGVGDSAALLAAEYLMAIQLFFASGDAKRSRQTSSTLSTKERSIIHFHNPARSLEPPPPPQPPPPIWEQAGSVQRRLEGLS